MSNGKRNYTASQLAKHWGVSTTLIYDLLNAGKLKGFRLGKLWRIPVQAVEEYEQGIAPEEEDEAPQRAARAAPKGITASFGGRAAIDHAARLERMKR